MSRVLGGSSTSSSFGMAEKSEMRRARLLGASVMAKMARGPDWPRNMGLLSKSTLLVQLDA